MYSEEQMEFLKQELKDTFAERSMPIYTIRADGTGTHHTGKLFSD